MKFSKVAASRDVGPLMFVERLRCSPPPPSKTNSKASKTLIVIQGINLGKIMIVEKLI